MRHTLAFSLALVLAVTAAACTDSGTMITAPQRPDSAASDETLSSSARGGRPASTGVIYVTGQGLYYDTFVAKDPLPMEGPFQLLVNGTTEFGPGDSGYLGGRWWEDLNGSGMQDAGDHFFLCPLLPPGRTEP
jgi:hypothetical protein